MHFAPKASANMLLTAVFLLLGQLSSAAPVTRQPGEMLLWGTDTAHPTWQLTLTNLEPRYVLNQALLCWDWVSEQPYAFGDTGNIVVAAFYNVHDGRTVLSTVPKGSYRAFMTDLRNEGTAWAAAAAAYIHDPHLFHAEDGALLEAEATSTDLGLQGGKYKTGSFMWAVGGKTKRNRGSVPACYSKDNGKYAGCSTTLRNMNIQVRVDDMLLEMPMPPASGMMTGQTVMEPEQLAIDSGATAIQVPEQERLVSAAVPQLTRLVATCHTYATGLLEMVGRIGRAFRK